MNSEQKNVHVKPLMEGSMGVINSQMQPQF